MTTKDDFSAFSDANFNAKDWLNNAFKSSEAVNNKDAFAASLVMKLQLYTQEKNHLLEDTSQQILQGLPRIVKDAEALTHEAVQLQQQMQNVKDDIVKVERNTAESMQTLVKIDSIKTRMLSASKALQEADNWTTLSTSVDDVFKTGDIIAISENILAMQQSLEILVDVPDYKERVLHLENLKNRLEALLSPQLIAAFNSQPIESTLVYVKIFRDIHRLQELEKLYHKCHKGQLLKKWKAIVEQDPDESLPEWLNNFYDILLSMWHTQAKWCNQLFVETPPVNILCRLLADILISMDPNVTFCIDAALKQEKSQLEYLLNLKQISERFLKSIEQAIQLYGTESDDREVIDTLAQRIMFPYQTYVQRYPEYEENLLLSQLDSVVINSEDLPDSIRLLGESSAKIFSFLNQASARCIAFTNGCLFYGLTEKFKVFFSSYIQRFHQVLEQLKRCYIASDNQTTVCYDWSIFQHVLNIVQATGELVLQVDAFDQSLIMNQLTAAKKGNFFKNDEKQELTAFQRPDKFLLSPNDQAHLQRFIIKLQHGSNPTVLSSVKSLVFRLNERTIDGTFELIFSQIERYLSPLPTMKVWTESNAYGVLTHELPSYSISPLEYITQIGQYLMTIPQHIEPFTLQENSALKAAFRETKKLHSAGQALEQAEELADYILNCIALGVMDSYAKVILKIEILELQASKQLVTDIEYLFNVLDDLGLKATEEMQNLFALLKATPETYVTVMEGKPSYIVKTVSSMRNIRI